MQQKSLGHVGTRSARSLVLFNYPEKKKSWASFSVFSLFLSEFDHPVMVLSNW